MDAEKIIYNLVLERKPGDYNVIEINSLLTSPGNFQDIGSIDLFTSKYKDTELRELIAKNNVVSLEYLNGTFKIVSNFHHNLPILTREKFDIINEFKYLNEEVEQSFKDKLYSYYKNVLEKLNTDYLFNENLKRYKLALNMHNYKEVMNLINAFPYVKARNIYFMIYDEMVKRKDAKIRKLEKLGDVA